LAGVKADFRSCVIQMALVVELSGEWQSNRFSVIQRKYSMTTRIHHESDGRSIPTRGVAFDQVSSDQAMSTTLAIRTKKQDSPGSADGSASMTGDAFSGRDLVVRLVSRDASALEELFDRMSGRVFGLAYRILGDGPAAEDVVQDVLVWVWDNPGKLDADRWTIDGLVITLTHRRSIDALRVRSRRAALPVLSFDSRIDDEVVELVAEVQRNLDGEVIRAVITKLPAEQLEIVELAYFGGMTHKEISDQTGLPLGTVKSRLRLGVAGLRKLFGLAGSGGAS
jgi:RNA polymerase sigma-70 factor (ECF subfamily)